MIDRDWSAGAATAQAADHVEFDLAVGQHVRPEQRGRAAPVFGVSTSAHLGSASRSFAAGDSYRPDRPLQVGRRGFSLSPPVISTPGRWPAGGATVARLGGPTR